MHPIHPVLLGSKTFVALMPETPRVGDCLQAQSSPTWTDYRELGTSVPLLHTSRTSRALAPREFSSSR
jgi:hypothetical protein